LSRAGRPKNAIVNRQPSIVNQNMNATNEFRALPRGYYPGFSVDKKDLSVGMAANVAR
jgi:hypothetical protein